MQPIINLATNDCQSETILKIFSEFFDNVAGRNWQEQSALYRAVGLVDASDHSHHVGWSAAINLDAV